MRQQVSLLTQSRFHSPAFNGAIFDGPLRIYFAQYQEQLALNVYFYLQKKFKDVLFEIREVFRKSEVNIFIMLYPSDEAFKISFQDVIGANITIDRLGHDFVVGVPGPVSDMHLDSVAEKIKTIMDTIRDLVPPESLQKLTDQVHA